jgi:hypothetical protein
MRHQISIVSWFRATAFSNSLPSEAATFCSAAVADPHQPTSKGENDDQQ